MIIGFAGSAGCGKTTAADVLVEHREFHKLSFAGPVKQEVGGFLRALGAEFEERHLYGVKADKEEMLYLTPEQYRKAQSRVPEFGYFSVLLDTSGFGYTMRQLLQWWGTDYRRKQDPDYWTKQGMFAARMLSSAGVDVVFDDVRFPDEVKALRGLGGKVYRIERPGFAGDGHLSERALDGFVFDGSIPNEAGVGEFMNSVLRRF